MNGLANRSTVSVLLCAFMCLGAASCRQSEESQHKGDADSSTNLTVGVVLPLTGLLAEMGNTEKKAIELALSQKKIDGSRGLRVLFEDGKGDAKAVVAAANKLAGIDKVAMLITSTSGGSLAARPVAETFGIPLIAFCMDAEIAAKSPTTVRYYLGLEEESNAIVKYLLGLPADTKIAILHGAISAWVSAVNTIYRPRLSSHFSAPALIEEYDLKSRDFRSQLAKIKSANVRVLVILGYGFEYGPLFTQIEESGIRDSAEIVGGWGFLYTGLATSQLEGIKVAGPKYVFERGTKGQLFDEKYEARYSRPANFDAAFAYELAQQLPFILDILQREGPNGIKQALVSRGKIEGVIGPYHISPEGNMIAETAVGVYRNGRIVSF